MFSFLHKEKWAFTAQEHMATHKTTVPSFVAEKTEFLL